MAHDFKRSGFIRAGFQYQDLVAVAYLIDFYRDRTRFEWITVESEDPAVAAIDDVVACRADGLFELTQVKFAIDPENEQSRLDWPWLLRKKKRGTSMLQKWCKTTLHHLNGATLAIAQLKTDRIPSEKFGQALDGSKIIYDRVDRDTQNLIEEQLGSERHARLFFGAFDFCHSQPQLDDLEAQLWKRVANDTDRDGWASFRARVEGWAIRRNFPGPDGRIRYIHLQQAFSVERPTPIPQNFRIPDTYSVPDKSFDQSFRDHVTKTDGVTVLWGPPGRGKSTYLSHCINRFDKRKTLCIRHHYFLGLDDRTEGRFHVQVIARAFQQQLKDMLPNFGTEKTTIGQAIEYAARLAREQGRRLVVVIDGLDHVWRENRDREHMEELFNGLLPLVDNIHLVIGTQKIAIEHLPARLVAVKPTEHWTELPLMSISAVRKWVKKQYEAGRLNLSYPEEKCRERNKVADAFHEISGGLPLHLIYSFEMVVRSGQPVRHSDIALLPTCPSGDIRVYYRQFFDRVSPRAKNVLHLLAGLRFAPPPFALGECLGDNEYANTVAEIGHLLEFQETQVLPFHGSLFAFFSDMADHGEQFRAQLDPVINWLSTKAPDYWRTAWLWVTQAQTGDDMALITQPSWKWAVDFLTKGYPIDQLIAILGHAEKAAFNRLDLAQLLILRSLKIRALNGPEFQTTDWSMFPTVANMLADDPIPASLMRTSMHRVPSMLLPYIVGGVDDPSRVKVAQQAIDEVNERIERSKQSDHYDRSHFQQLAHAAAGIVASLGVSSVGRLVRFAKHNDGTDAIMAVYARTSILLGHFENVFLAAKRWSGPEFDRELFATFALEGLGPGCRPEVLGSRSPAMRVLAILKGQKPLGGHKQRDLTDEVSRGPDPGHIWAASLKPILYNAYFECLAARLAGKNAKPWSHFTPTDKSVFVEQGLKAIEALAGFVADTWINQCRWPTLAEFYHAFDAEVPLSRAYEVHRQVDGVRLALAEIAQDHLLLGRALHANFIVGSEDLKRAATSPFWNDELWLQLFCERRYILHDPDAASIILDKVASAQLAERSETNERADLCIQLALFAADNGLIEVGRCQLKRAFGCLLGYGWRKDTFVFEVLQSIEMLLRYGDDEVRHWLLEVAAPVDLILDYTDGKETRHAPSQLHQLLIEAWPDRAARCLETLLDDERWHLAEDLLKHIATHSVCDSEAGRLLLGTYISPSERRTVLSAIKAKPELKKVMAQILVETGLNLKVERNRNAMLADSERGTPIPKDTKRPPKYIKFPPGTLANFMDELRRRSIFLSRGNVLTNWLDYWVSQGLAKEALDDLEDATSATDIYFYIGNTLDRAAQISLNLQGRNKAFEWLIRAQIINNSWSGYYTSEADANSRMDFVALHFRDRWEEFLRRTSQSASAYRREGGELTVGYSRLVYFLLAVGEIERAKNCTRAMIDTYLAELSDQPLVTPDWAK